MCAGWRARRAALAAVEPARLVEDRVRDGELADVVQERGAAEGAAARSAPSPSAAGERHGDRRDPRRVLGGVGRLGVDDRGEGVGDAVEAGRRRRAGRGRQARARRRARVAARRGGPEARSSARGAAARRRARGRTSARRARARAPRGAGAAGAGEHLGGLGEPGDARQQRDSTRPRRPSGKPLPSQRSSSARMACAVASGSSSMRATSAPRSQRCGAISRRAAAARANASHAADAARARQRAGARRRAHHVARRPGRALRSTSLRSCLRSRSSPPNSARDVGGVRRAARVLEQQRVVERRAVVGASRSSAAARRMPIRQAAPGVAQRLALGEVERDRKAGEDLRQAQCCRAGCGHRVVQA